MPTTELPAGPRFAPLQAARYARNPLRYLESTWRRHGDVFTIPYPLGRMVYFVDPDAIKQIYQGDPSVFYAGEPNVGPLAPLTGEHSVFLKDGADHMRRRKILLPPFHGKAIAHYEEVFADVAAREIERWPVGEPFALRPRMQWLALEIILRTVFGVNDEERLARYHERVPRLGSIAQLIVFSTAFRRNLGPWSPWPRFLRARAAVHELAYEEIDRAPQDPGLEERDDILALLLRARHEDGSPLGRDELRDELMTVVAAGHETTATALSWFFERVLRHPDVEERLRAEIDAGEDKYLEATVAETLRVRPVVGESMRKVKRDVEIVGQRIPAETIVVPAIALLHLREDLYEEPHAFRPERFLEKPPGTYTFIAFGGGVRRCIGAAFATVEVKTIARAILERARLEAPDQEPETPRARHVTIAPGRETEVVLRERLAPRARLAPVATVSELEPASNRAITTTPRSAS